MNVLKSILEGKIPLSKELTEWVYECSECGNCTEVCHMSQNPYIILPTCNWIDHVKVWEALRKDLVEAGFAPLDRHDSLIKYMDNDNKFDMNDVESHIASIMQNRINDWERSQVFVTDRISFQIRELVKLLRRNYWGVFNETKDPNTGREKIWVPLSESIVTIS